MAHFFKKVRYWKNFFSKKSFTIRLPLPLDRSRKENFNSKVAPILSLLIG